MKINGEVSQMTRPNEADRGSYSNEVLSIGLIGHLTGIHESIRDALEWVKQREDMNREQRSPQPLHESESTGGGCI